MLRSTAIALILLALALAALGILNRQPNNGLPLVRVALKEYPKDHMLFAPCEGPRYAPRKQRNVV